MVSLLFNAGTVAAIVFTLGFIGILPRCMLLIQIYRQITALFTSVKTSVIETLKQIPYRCLTV